MPKIQKKQTSQKAKNSFKDYYKMKGVFWNSRGLTDLAKHRFLAKIVKEEQINFIALSETGRESFPDHVLKNLCAYFLRNFTLVK
jgi:predicted SprT family Zn-dependent metalloprotease